MRFRTLALSVWTRNFILVSSLFLIVGACEAAIPVAPSSLTVYLTKQTSSHTYAFLWNDNSTDETTFSINYRIGTSGSFLLLANVTSSSPASTGSTGVVYPGITALAVNTTIQFQVTASNASGTSGSSNTFSVTIPADAFAAPTIGTTTATSETVVNTSWTDNSTTEDGEELELSSDGGTTYSKLGDITFYQAKSISITGLEPAKTYKVRLRAYKEGSPRTYTAYSGIGTATTPFNAPTGLTASATGNRTVNLTWTDNSATEGGYAVYFKLSTAGSYMFYEYASANATSLTVKGLFKGTSYDFQVAAAYQSTTVVESARSNTANVSTTGVFTGPATPSAPQISAGFSTLSLAPGGSSNVSLTGKFSDPDTESAVRMSTSKGNLDVILYDAETPITVTNFKGYVSRGDYNGCVFNRLSSLSDSGVAVLQGGQYKLAAPTDTQFTSIPTQLAIENEPGISNVPYTIAMAKLGNDVNSATSQFYFNLDPTNTLLDAATLNGGFTVFGRVSNATHSVLDALLGYPGGPYTFTADGATVSTNTFKWPMNVGSAGEVPGQMDYSKVMTITSVSPITALLNYSVASDNLAVAGATIDSGNVVVNAGVPGTATITITATDLDGNTTSQTFTVNVNEAPAFTSSPPISTGLVGSVYNFVCTASGFPVPSFAVTAGTLPPGLNLESNGAITGSPTAAGTFTGTITASSTAGSATQDFSITVNQTPAFTSSQPTGTAMVGSAYSFTCTASGVPSPTFSVTAGSLPTGLALAANGAITGTPSVGGAFTGTVTATNAAGSATQNFSVTVTASLDSWAASKGLTGNDALVDADPDHDGRTNLMEFAFMSDPTASEGGDGPSYDLASSSDLKYGEITFPVRKFAPTLTYKVEVSDSLTSGSWSTLWSSAGGFGSPYSTVEQADCTWVTVRDTEPSPPATRRFLRVTVSQP